MYIFAISGSPRKGGNTEIMVEAFAEGARDSGHTVAVKKMSQLTVAPCLACEYCFTHDGVCVQKDGMAEILAEADKADMLVFASPIYWFNMSAQMRCVIDRLYARAKKGFHAAKTALLLDSGSPDVYTGAIASYQDANAYLNWQDMGIIAIAGMDRKGDMKSSPRLEEVRAFGRSLK